MSRKMTRQVRPIVGLMLASAMFCAGGVAVVAAPAPQAHAVSMSEYQAKVSNHAKLKSQLVGVSSDLADTILQLADLNDNRFLRRSRPRNLPSRRQNRRRAWRKRPRSGCKRPAGQGEP